MRNRPLCLLLAVLPVFACSGSNDQRLVYPRESTSDYAIAGGITAAAAVIYVVGGGCKISDCPTGTVCNPSSERCERVECGGPLGNVNSCPANTQCEPSTNTCVPF